MFHVDLQCRSYGLAQALYVEPVLFARTVRNIVRLLINHSVGIIFDY